MARRALLWKYLDTQRQGFEVRWRGRIRKEFQREQEQVLAAWSKPGAVVEDALRASQKRWHVLLTALWKEALAKFGSQTARQLGATVVGGRRRKADGETWQYDPWSRHYQDAVRNLVGRKVTQVTDATRREIARIVGKNSQHGGPDRTAAEIKRMYGGFSAHRSWKIARTEGAMAANYAHHNAALDSGMATTKTWLTSKDSRVRHYHRPLDGVTVPMGTRFPNGLMYPCDPEGAAREVIHCRCVATYSYNPAKLPDDAPDAPVDDLLPDDAGVQEVAITPPTVVPAAGGAGDLATTVEDAVALLVRFPRPPLPVLQQAAPAVVERWSTRGEQDAFDLWAAMLGGLFTFWTQLEWKPVV